MRAAARLAFANKEPSCSTLSHLKMSQNLSLLYEIKYFLCGCLMTEHPASISHPGLKSITGQIRLRAEWLLVFSHALLNPLAVCRLFSSRARIPFKNCCLLPACLKHIKYVSASVLMRWLSRSGFRSVRTDYMGYRRQQLHHRLLYKM